MIKKKYIKRAYIEEAYCDKCGSLLKPTGVVLTTYPCQYPYCCTNEECDYYTAFIGDDRPGVVKYEFEDGDEEISPIAHLELLPDSYELKMPFIHTIDTAIVEDI